MPGLNPIGTVIQSTISDTPPPASTANTNSSGIDQIHDQVTDRNIQQISDRQATAETNQARLQEIDIRSSNVFPVDVDSQEGITNETFNRSITQGNEFLTNRGSLTEQSDSSRQSKQDPNAALAERFSQPTDNTPQFLDVRA